MRTLHIGHWVLIASLLLTACAQNQGQSNYHSSEIGVSRKVEFGTVINVREVKITNTDEHGTGALLGAGAGAGAGSAIGNGSGNTWAIIGGALAGALVGSAVEQEVRNSQGYEYTLAMRDGDTKTITLEKIQGDQIFKPGDKVMLQRCDAGKDTKKCNAASQFQRLLPVSQFPPEPEKKKRKKTKNHSDE